MLCGTLECTLEFVIPIRSVFVHDLSEDGLQYFIRGFGQKVCLRVVRHAFQMYYHAMWGEFSNKAIEKMPALVVDELYSPSKTTL